MSVRETEALVRRLGSGSPAGSSGAAESAAAAGGSSDPNVSRLEQELAEKLGAKVTIQHAASGKGKVVVTYNSLDELDGILAHIQ
jgi:ParB family chromosome partitioning protein